MISVAATVAAMVFILCFLHQILPEKNAASGRVPIISASRSFLSITWYYQHRGSFYLRTVAMTIFNLQRYKGIIITTIPPYFEYERTPCTKSPVKVDHIQDKGALCNEVTFICGEKASDSLLEKTEPQGGINEPCL